MRDDWIGSGRHALLHACGAQPLAEGAAAILTATVAVEDDALGAASGSEGGVEGLDDEMLQSMVEMRKKYDREAAKAKRGADLSER